MPKYIIVTGGVMSGLGKGVVTASICKILQVRGFEVGALKIDPYLNCDAGTMNPFQHGEVFVTDDGFEGDQDLGTYERFLDQNLSFLNNITTGQVYSSVIERERRGEYLGKCVQIIPHITDEIKDRIRKAGKGKELVVIEIGGTVGDIEGQPFLEAVRQMRAEEGKEDCLFVHLTYVPHPPHIGEFKTKPTQHSTKELRSIGIVPNIIIARTSDETPLDEPSREKIALFCDVEKEAIFSLPDLPSTYQVPLFLDEQGLGHLVIEHLSLEPRQPQWTNWKTISNSFIDAHHTVKIAITGKYTGLMDSYISVNEALHHAGAILDTEVDINWVSTELFEKYPEKINNLKNYDGILVPGGFGVRGTEGKILTIKYARENLIPYLGICFGLQLAVVEFARNIVGLDGANSTEIDSNTPYPVIDLLPEQTEITDKGGTMRLGFYPTAIELGTLAYELYGKKLIHERHRHRFEVSPDYHEILEKNGLIFSGRSPDKYLVEIIELPRDEHPFFFGTQFHPEFKSRPGNPSPPYFGFVKSALERKLRKEKILEESIDQRY